MDLAGTWNTSGTPTAIKLNITDTASNGASLLMDLQVGGASRFQVAKDGSIGVPNQKSLYVLGNAGFNITFDGTGEIKLNPAGFRGVTINGDLTFRRRAAANFQLGLPDDATSTTVTITIATPGVVTWTSHGLSTGTPVIFSTTGALPTGITAGATYYVIFVNVNTFRIATSLANALAGTAVNTSGSQSGTQTGSRGAITQTSSVQSVVAGTTNFPGADMLITGSQGTGTGAGGSLIFQVAPAGSSGSAQNALVAALTINGTGDTVSVGTVPLVDQSRSGQLSIGGKYYFSQNIALGLSIADPNYPLSWGTGLGSADLFLRRDAANTLALRNGGTVSVPVPQTFNVYNFWQDASNYERLSTYWAGNTAYILSASAGTGVARNLVIGTALSSSLVFWTAAVERWQINTSGHFLAGADNTYDIGAATATRPRNVFIAGYNQLSEMTAPAAPAANGVRIYAVDNGSGKTQLMALFATGAAQQIAIEP
jgi:hypothetical protein